MNEIERLKERIDEAEQSEDYGKAADACLDYLEFHYGEVAQTDRHAGTDHIIAALRQINRAAGP